MSKIEIEQKELFQIDKRIDDLVKQIELLSYVNPINIESEKILFFNSKYIKDPVFKYPDINFDKFKLHRELFTQPLEQIENLEIRQLYEDIIYNYSGLIQCIETIGEGKKFYYNSLHSFGTPTEKHVENAKFILHFNDKNENDEVFKPIYNVHQTEQLFREFSKRYDFTYSIRHSNKMSAIAMVLNNVQTLVLNENHIFSKNQIAILTNHEIGVHMVTTMNGLLQPLKIFSHGFPDNIETQEGLAVYSEYMSNSLTLKRLKELAYRVIAVDSLAKGYSFSRTFRLLHNGYDLDRETAFKITVRVHRGGGFTKDYLYLSGLKKIYDFHQKGNDLNLLLSGKVTLEYSEQLHSLLDLGLAIKPKHITDSYLINQNTDSTVEFILKNLK